MIENGVANTKLPDQLVYVESIPYINVGKSDKKKISRTISSLGGTSMETEFLLKWQAFRDEVCNMLNPGGQIANDANLLHMGLSSIEMMKLINVSKKTWLSIDF